MHISDSHEFIFVHVQKAAGTSIRIALEPYSLPRNRTRTGSVLRALGLPRDYRRYKFRGHAPIQDAEARMPTERYRRYFKFAFVRNPWDRLVARFVHDRYRRGQGTTADAATVAEFARFVEREIRRNKFRQLPMLTGRNGDMAMDFVGRFENLRADYRHVCERIDIDDTLSHHNRFLHPPYRDFYDDVSRQRVADHWDDEIRAFGYAF